jgi:hypothetical protein
MTGLRAGTNAQEFVIFFFSEIDQAAQEICRSIGFVESVGE